MTKSLWQNHFMTKSLATSVPYKNKKVQNFLQHFRTEILRIPTFFLPPKTVDSCSSRRLTLVCRTNCGEKLQNSVEGPFFFFGDQHKIGEKDASISAMTFFFFLEITLKPHNNDEKIFGIFTLSLEHSHYFRHFCRRWKLRGNTAGNP